MNYEDLKKLCKFIGFEECKCRGKGDHIVFKREFFGIPIIIPKNDQKDYPDGTAFSIISYIVFYAKVLGIDLTTKKEIKGRIREKIIKIYERAEKDILQAVPDKIREKLKIKTAEDFYRYQDEILEKIEEKK